MDSPPYKWIQLMYSPDEYTFGKSYGIIIYVDKSDTFYFFGNAVFYLLGFDRPHVALQSHVPSNEQHKVLLGSGIFLTESTVRRLINERYQTKIKFKKRQVLSMFQHWLDDYMSKCKGTNLGTPCPY